MVMLHRLQILILQLLNARRRMWFNAWGNEIMYNSRTGEQMKTKIFVGPTYYQRLKHMVTIKCIPEIQMDQLFFSPDNQRKVELVMVD